MAEGEAVIAEERGEPEIAPAAERERLDPLPYHREIVAYLRHERKEVWDWFASHPVSDEHAAQTRLELLKSTYRLEPAAAPRLYAAANATSQRLKIGGPIVFYQAQQAAGSNLHLAYLPEETHIVLHGPVAEILSDRELEAAVAHELSHRLLWTEWDGEFLVADQILAAMANESGADPAQTRSARLFRLYTEIFCDRGSLLGCGELPATVATLVKIETGLKEISGESYLRQADEIFSHEKAKTDGVTHPESFIRARALGLWADREQEAEEKIRGMIEGERTLSGLDLLGQVEVSHLTRRLIDRFLSPKWLQTEITLGHARLYFEGYSPPRPPIDDESLEKELRTVDDRLQEYFCYVLLDFVTTDRDLEEAPLAAALLLTDRLGLADRFETIARSELPLRKKQFDRIRGDAAKLTAEAERPTKGS